MKCRADIKDSVALLGVVLLLCTGGAFAADKTKGGSHARPAEAAAKAAVRPVESLSPARIDELRGMMEAHSLTELRTTYNGSYGASLLLQTDKPTYYIALFKNKDFWRVIKTDVFADAESVYAAFAEQSAGLARVEIETIRLDAERKFAEQLLSQNRDRLQNLRTAQTRQEQEAAQVAAVQQQRRQQAAALSSDLRQTSSELDSVQSNIRLLERMQADPRLSLPASSGSSATP